MKFAFFGTPNLTIPVLEKLKQGNLIPSLIVAAPDAPIGRKQVMTSPPSVDWARENKIAIWQPKNKAELTSNTSPLTETNWDVFVVFAYGAILPRSIIELPLTGTLNLHPSLLPKLRGPSPIRSAILTDQRETGATIIKLDTKMDHGPIIAQETVTVPEADWPLAGRVFDELLVTAGAELLAQTLPAWCRGDIKTTTQDDTTATYCRMIQKEDARLDIDPSNLPTGDAAYQALLKIKAYDVWPTAFFEYQGQRVKILDASLDGKDKLNIHQVIPAGKQAMDFSTYKQSI